MSLTSKTLLAKAIETFDRECPYVVHNKGLTVSRSESYELSVLGFSPCEEPPKKPVYVTLTPVQKADGSKRLQIAKVQPSTKIPVFDLTKHETCSTGVNTDTSLLDDVFISSLKTKRDIGVQTVEPVDFVTDITKEICKDYLLEEYNEQFKIQANERFHFKHQLFLDLKSCLNYDGFGNLPLHQAVMANNLNLVIRYCTAMKIRKQDIDTPNGQQQSALQLAVILDAHIDIIVQLIRQFQANVDALDFSNGNSIIHLAVLHTAPETLEVLLSLVKPSNFNLPNFDGVTPLIMCVQEKEITKLEGLLKKGVDPNIAENKSGRTALFFAIELDNAEMVRLLLDYNAETKRKNFNGYSPHDVMHELMEVVNNDIRSMILNHSRNKYKRKRANMTNNDNAAGLSKRVAHFMDC